MYLSEWEILLRLSIATALGFLFGAERSWRKKPVGVRTHVLISLTACLVTMISAYGFSDVYLSYPIGVNVNTDPARLVVGVLTGMGFIGAGIIWRSGDGRVQGITTAAELFLLAALGIACGTGMYFLVAATTVIALLNVSALTIRDWFLYKVLKKEKKTTPDSTNDTAKK